MICPGIVAMHERWEEIVSGIFGYLLTALFILALVMFIRLYLRSRANLAPTTILPL
jgi:hypothetical protein